MLAQTALQCEPQSVRAARRFVSEALHSEHAPAELVDIAALLVSELVSNALLHARSGIQLRVACRPNWARVDVSDEDPRGPVRRRHRLDATTGRGLLFVEELASNWGVELAGVGKRVWFEINSRTP